MSRLNNLSYFDRPRRTSIAFRSLSTIAPCFLCALRVYVIFDLILLLCNSLLNAFSLRIQSENKLYLAKFKGCSYDEENLYLFELDTDSAVNSQWLKFIKRYNKRRALIRSGKLTGGPVVKQWWLKVLCVFLCSAFTLS